jgi:hypothetical protein
VCHPIISIILKRALLGLLLNLHCPLLICLLFTLPGNCLLRLPLCLQCSSLILLALPISSFSLTSLLLLARSRLFGLLPR